MRSIRSFLLSRLLGGTAIVLAVVGTTACLVLTKSVAAQFDRNLADRVRAFGSLLFQVEDDVSFEFSGELMPEYERENFPAYFQIWFEDGRLLERSESLGGSNLEVPFEPSDSPSHWTADLPDGREGRFVAKLLEVHHVYPEEGPDRPEARRVLVVVALGREALVRAERSVLTQTIAMALAILGLIAFLSIYVVERGLEPTERLAASLDAIRPDDLPNRLEVGPLPPELDPVVDTTNALIRRVDHALKRERRTTADIAHELRTPISELLTVSEVALRGADQDAESTRALGLVRDVSARMGRSISTLLKLARLEMGAESFDREELDLADVVDGHLRSLVTIGRERALEVQNDVAAGAHVEGDREAIRIIVANLLSNALYYAPAGGRVACSFAHDAGRWRFVVENEATGLDDEDLQILTAPFWRKDRARGDRKRTSV